MSKNSKGFEENLYFGNKGDIPTGIIRVHSGIYVDVFNPTEDMFCIEDIAHGLSMNPRFGGHMKTWYSVADHCIRCSDIEHVGYQTSYTDAYNLLMHDCSEAYLLDIPSPIKKLLYGYCDLEDKLMKVLSEKFKFDYPLNDFCKAVDRSILEFEWNNFVINLNTTQTFTQKKSKQSFLDLFEYLTKDKKF